MHLRTGFVSNSSSASFVLSKKYLPSTMFDAIRKPLAWAQTHKFKCVYPSLSSNDEWHVQETETAFRGSTFMDNLNITAFFAELFDAFQLPFPSIETDGHGGMFDDTI